MGDVRWLLERDPIFSEPQRLAALLPDALVVDDLRTARLPPAPEGPLAAYGTIRGMAALRRQPGWCEAVFDQLPALRCSAYYGPLYAELGRQALLAPLAALPHLDLERWFGARVFVRPDGNHKPFPGQVIRCQAAAQLLADHRAHGDALVVLSEVVELGSEVRCFCRAGRVVASSSYPDPPYAPASPEVVDFAESIARRLLSVVSSTMLTVDVADDGRRLRLVEIGGVNSWALYGASPEAFIAAMEAEARARYADR